MKNAILTALGFDAEQVDPENNAVIIYLDGKRWLRGNVQHDGYLEGFYGSSGPCLCVPHSDDPRTVFATLATRVVGKNPKRGQISKEIERLMEPGVVTVKIISKREARHED